MTDPVPDRLASALKERYAIERELGRGGMATVYLAADLKHRRRVAIKVLDPELAGAIGPGRFLHEIRIAASLTHPNIVPLHDSGEADGLLFYVMPYIEGESLRDRLDRERHLSLDETVQIVRGVAAALGYAHQQGVIHRDIKPENILLAGEQAIVADFGIAHAIDAAGTERLTSTGLAIGTPAYMSPEQVGADRTLDGRSDIYSLGCTAYEMLGGAPPFTGPSAQAVMARHAIDPPPPLRTLRPALPRGVEAAVERALAKVPKDRFATADDFAATLTRASTAQAIAAEQGRAQRTKLRWVAGIATVSLLVAAAVWRVAGSGGTPAIHRFAVLPFDDPADSTQAYFAQGMHEAVISDLADEGLGVIARTSVLQYQHSDKPIRVIAQELGVDALVETSLLRAHDSVTVQARLVNARSEQYLWHHTYAASLAEVPTLAESVARGIAAAISPQAATLRLRKAAAAPVDPQAYDDYLKGLSYLHRPPYTPTDLETARQYFERAIARDSTYAPAWAAISEYWTTARQRGYFTPREATPPSEAAAYRALALDSLLAQPHFALAMAKVYGEWDWQGADLEYRRSIQLQPDYAEARAFYAHLLLILHRPDDALLQMNRARELDPLDPLLLWINGLTLVALGRNDDAIALYREALARSPKIPTVNFLLWQALDLEGRITQADSAMQRWTRVNGDSGLAGAMARGHRQGGYLGAVLAGATYRAAHEPPTRETWNKAIWYAIAHDDTAAITWLERAFDERDPAIPYLDVHPRFNALHGNPQFEALVKRMNLPG